MRLASILLVIAMASVAACSSPQRRVAEPSSGAVASTSAVAARPLVNDARALAGALRGRVVVARFTDPSRNQGVADIVYYRPNGEGYVQRLLDGGPLRRFQWDVRAAAPQSNGGYIFISSDGSDDGAAVGFDRERQRLVFSDRRNGPYFSYGVIQECWPGFAPVRPPEIRICNAAMDNETLRRLAAEQPVVAAWRAAANPRARVGAFTTHAGATYATNLGNTISVKQVDGHTVTFTNQSGAVYVSHALLYARNPQVVGNEKVFAAIDQLWPLAVGKQTEAWVYNGRWSWKLNWKVTRREDVTVPAGTFDTWVIEHTETSLGGDYVGKSETWYAPEIGWNVRYRSWVETDPNAPKTEWALALARP